MLGNRVLLLLLGIAFKIVNCQELLDEARDALIDSLRESLNQHIDDFDGYRAEIRGGAVTAAREATIRVLRERGEAEVNVQLGANNSFVDSNAAVERALESMRISRENNVEAARAIEDALTAARNIVPQPDAQPEAQPDAQPEAQPDAQPGQVIPQPPMVPQPGQVIPQPPMVPQPGQVIPQPPMVPQPGQVIPQPPMVPQPGQVIPQPPMVPQPGQVIPQPPMVPQPGQVIPQPPMVPQPGQVIPQPPMVPQPGQANMRTVSAVRIGCNFTNRNEYAIPPFGGNADANDKTCVIDLKDDADTFLYSCDGVSDPPSCPEYINDESDGVVKLETFFTGSTVANKSADYGGIGNVFHAVTGKVQKNVNGKCTCRRADGTYTMTIKSSANAIKVAGALALSVFYTLYNL